MNKLRYFLRRRWNIWHTSCLQTIRVQIRERRHLRLPGGIGSRDTRLLRISNQGQGGQLGPMDTLNLHRRLIIREAAPERAK